MLNADGGTDIFPAMDAAYRQIRQKNSKVNHVILLSDGNTKSIYYHYNKMISKFQKAHITVSTIALGTWLVNTKLLEDIAKKTKGQFYQITDVIRLPRLIIKDSEFFDHNQIFMKSIFIRQLTKKARY